MSEKIYSVELQENEWADDTFTGEFEDCVEFCNGCGYKIDGVNARIAEIQHDETGAGKCISTVCSVGYDVRKGWSFNDDYTDEPGITQAEFVDFEMDWEREIAENYDDIMEHISGEPEDYEVTLSYYFSPEYDVYFEADSHKVCDTITAKEIFDIIKQKDFELLKLEADERAKELLKLEADERAKNPSIIDKMDTLRKNFSEAFRKIALDDYHGKLEHKNYYLGADEDGKMAWYPGQKEGAVLYSKDSDLQDDDEDEAIRWIDEEIKLKYHLNFEALMEQFLISMEKAKGRKEIPHQMRHRGKAI